MRVPTAVGAWLVALVALLVGTGIGWFVQSTATALRRNGAWPDTPAWKKRAIGASGSIAAFVAGVYVLSDAPTFSGQTFVFRLWLWQVLSAWAGATALDMAVERFKGGSK